MIRADAPLRLELQPDPSLFRAPEPSSSPSRDPMGERSSASPDGGLPGSYGHRLHGRRRGDLFGHKSAASSRHRRDAHRTYQLVAGDYRASTFVAAVTATAERSSRSRRDAVSGPPRVHRRHGGVGRRRLGRRRCGGRALARRAPDAHAPRRTSPDVQTASLHFMATPVGRGIVIRPWPDGSPRTESSPCSTPSFAYNDEEARLSRSKTETTPAWWPWRWWSGAGRRGPAGASRPATAHHGGDHPAARATSPWSSTGRSAETKDTARLLRRRAARTSTTPSRPPRSWPAPIRTPAPMRSALAVFRPGAPRVKRHRLDRRRLLPRPAPGAGRAPALFPRPRRRRGGVQNACCGR